jgi:acetyl esterase/lipase
MFVIARRRRMQTAFASAAHRNGKGGFNRVVRSAPHLGVDTDQIAIVGLSWGAGIATSTTLRVWNEDAEKSKEDEKRTKEGDEATPGEETEE